MTWGNVAGAAVSVVGGYLSSKGSKDKSAQKYQKQRNAFLDDFIQGEVQRSEDLVYDLWPDALDNLNMGYQSALDLYGQTIPQQMDVFQQGNVGAQNVLAGSAPQFSNAIMGLPVDYSFMQPTALNYNTDWAQQQLPQFHGVGDALSGTSAPLPPQTAGTGGMGRAAGKLGDKYYTKRR